jgi:prepilin-type N-terminal cleavage/methylation domain-containing protein
LSPLIISYHENGQMSCQRKPLVSLLLKAMQLEDATLKKHNSKGLTLIECLVAIVVISATAAVMAPVMVFSMATRLQSQKAEQALQLAQAEVETVRLLVERGGDYSTRLFAYPSTTTALTVLGAPAATAVSLSPTSPTTAKLINIDADPEYEFAIQAFRSPGTYITGSPEPIAFEMGVRVYDYATMQRAQAAGTTLRTDQASLAFTSGDGQRGSRPLAVLYTNFLKGDGNGALCQYRRYVSTTAASANTGLECN